MKKPERVETPKSYEELVEFMKGAAARVSGANGVDPKDGVFSGGYNQVPEEIWKAGLKAMQMVSYDLGATGFQFSHAELSLIQSSRQIEGPFMLVTVDDMLFPQNRTADKVEDFLTRDDTREYLKQAAQEKIDTYGDRLDSVHPSVLAHWQKLAAWEKK